jgi:hypothetical protein
MKRDPRNIRIALSRAECHYLLSTLGGFEHPDSRRSRQLQKFIWDCLDAQAGHVQSIGVDCDSSCWCRVSAKPSGKPVKRTGRSVLGDEAESQGRVDYKRITEGK